MTNGSKMLTIEEFEQKLRQQKDPMKISLSNPLLSYENGHSMSQGAMGSMGSLSQGSIDLMSPRVMHQTADLNQMKMKKDYYASNMGKGLKKQSSNSSLDGNSNNNGKLYRMNSEQTLLQSSRYGSNPSLPGSLSGSISGSGSLSQSLPNSLSGMDLAIGNKFFSPNNSDLTLDTSFRQMDSGSYEFNPMKSNKLMMNPSLNNSQSSFNSFGGFRDESFEEDSDFEDLIDTPPKRKQTETEALADFLKNTGPDMLGPPPQPILESGGKKKTWITL